MSPPRRTPSVITACPSSIRTSAPAQGERRQAELLRHLRPVAVRYGGQDERLVGITPAMREGSGLVKFSQQYPDRYFDVAIAEQHAVTFAAGLAIADQKPVVAIY